MSVAQTLWRAHRTYADFLLVENIKNCFEMCSNMLAYHAEFSFHHDDCLPEVISGDLDMLTLALQTLAEFALKYSSHDSTIVSRSNCDGIENENVYLVSFIFKMAINPEYDNEKIFSLLSVNDPFGKGTTSDDINTFLS